MYVILQDPILHNPVSIQIRSSRPPPSWNNHMMFDPLSEPLPLRDSCRRSDRLIFHEKDVVISLFILSRW